VQLQSRSQLLHCRRAKWRYFDELAARICVERASKPRVIAYGRSIQIENLHSLNSYPANINKIAAFAPEPSLRSLKDRAHLYRAPSAAARRRNTSRC
jgi:hypothetical protein